MRIGRNLRRVNHFEHRPYQETNCNKNQYIREICFLEKEIRQEKEKELFKKGEPIPQPSDADLRTEKQQIDPYLTFTISDEKGNPVRIIHKSVSKGINRLAWDLRYQSTRAVNADKYDPLTDNGSGILAMPGKYTVNMSLTAGGETKQLAGPVDFITKPLENTTLPAVNRQAVIAFHQKVADLTRIMQGTEEYAYNLNNKVLSILQAINSTPAAPPDLQKKARDIQVQLDVILNQKFNRQSARPSDEENPPAPVTLNQRLGKLSWISFGSTGDPTQTQRDAYSILLDEFPPVYEQVKQIGETEVPQLEKAMESIGAPVTPGRLPEWKK